MPRGCAWAFARARRDSFLRSASQYDVRVWVLGHPIIGMIAQDVMCLGSDWVTSEPDRSPIPPRRPGSSPCAKEVWAVPLQSRNSYHVDFSKEMHHIVVLCAAGTTKWWMERLAEKGYAHTHTLPPLLSLSPPINPHMKWVRALGYSTVAAMRAEKCVSCGILQSHAQGPWP